MVTYTSSPSYWAPLRPRVRIWAFDDTTYSTPLYDYNPFTDDPNTTTNKLVSLQFESLTDNVGSFSLEIEDSSNDLDVDTLTRGCRVGISCSKDGANFQTAFKGLVRSSEQAIYAQEGRNLILSGYSYLIRLTERVLNTIKESTVTGNDYNRTDTNMFTDNLINNLLTVDSNYVHSIDDTQAYSVFKTDNITSSPITDWVPRIDAQLVTVADAIDSVLEFSNSLLMIDFSTDQLMLYNSDLVTSNTGIFLLTDQRNSLADDAEITMYPLEPYSYNVSYDYPESGSKLIGSIGEAVGEECPEQPPSFPSSLVQQYTHYHHFFGIPEFGAPSGDTEWAQVFLANGPQLRGLSFAVRSDGNNSSATNAIARIYNNSQPVTGLGTIGTQVGSNIPVYIDGVPGTPFPSSTHFTSILSMGPGAVGPTVVTGRWYFIALIMTHSQNASNFMSWISEQQPDIPGTPMQRWDLGVAQWSQNGGSTWPGFIGSHLPGAQAAMEGGVMKNWSSFRWDYSFGGQDPCGGGGGLQATKDADPVFAMAFDRSMSSRLGLVERVVTDIPTHIKTKQTLLEFLTARLYTAAKPRFVFDYPSVSMPNRLPKAGDIIAHVDRRAAVGTTQTPVQTGVISSVNYDFSQTDTDAVLGLRKLGITTTGIRRGYY